MRTLSFTKPSSMIAGAVYEGQTLTVTIKDKQYVYEGISESLIDEWEQAESPGIFYNSRIKNNSGTVQTDLALPDMGSLLVFEAKKQYNDLIEKWGTPDGENEQALTEIKAARKAVYQRASEYKKKRLEWTRSMDEMKAKLMAPEKDCDALDKDFEQWELKFLQTKKALQERRLKEQEDRAFIESLDVRFRAHMDSAILAYESNLKTMLTAKFNTESAIPYQDLNTEYTLTNQTETGTLWGNMAKEFVYPIIEEFPELQDRLVEINKGLKEGLCQAFTDRMRVFCGELTSQIPAREAQIKAGIETDTKGAVEAIAKETEMRLNEIQRQERVETGARELEVMMTTQTEEVPTVNEYAPGLRVEWVRLLAVALNYPESETGLTKEWFDKNMGKVLTCMNKRLKDGGTRVDGVTIISKIKTKR